LILLLVLASTLNADFLASAYSGRATDADDAIEHYRKGDAVLSVLDDQGRPVVGASVSYRQVTTDFLFGVGAVAYPENVWLLLKEAGINYAEIVVTWNFTEGAFTVLWNTVTFLRDQEFTMSGHCLVWMVGDYPGIPSADPWNLPTRIKTLTYDELKKQLYDHVIETVNTYKPFITYWGINEPFWPYADPFHLNSKQWMEIVNISVQAIHEADPEGKIYMNNILGDVLPWNYYPLKQMKLLADKGIEFDVIGLELYGAGRTPIASDSNGNPVIASVSKRLDQFAELGKPIILTEVDVTSEPNEKVQAEWLRDAYTMAFAKPYVMGVAWAFLFDDPWLPKAGLFDCLEWGPYNTCLRFRPKQAYYALKDLTSSWQTEGGGTTDTEGRLRFRGFAGNYSITVNAKGLKPLEAIVHVPEQTESKFQVHMSVETRSEITSATAVSTTSMPEQATSPALSQDQVYVAVVVVSVACIAALLVKRRVRKIR
jgi:hypothetical protein